MDRACITVRRGAVGLAVACMATLLFARTWEDAGEQPAPHRIGVRDVAEIGRDIERLESVVKRLRDEITGLRADKVEDHRRVAVPHGVFETIPDGSVTNYITNATPESFSIEITTNLNQYHLFGFRTNGTYEDSIDATKWGYEGEDVYSVLLRYQGASGTAPRLQYGKAADVKAAVDAEATADYVGADGDSGFLHIGQVDATEGLDKTDGGDFVTMYHHNTSDAEDAGPFTGYDVISAIDLDTYGHVLDVDYRTLDIDAAITNQIPDGTANYQILYWKDNKWNLLNFGTTNTTVLQRGNDATLKYDFVRFWNGAP